TAVIEDFQPVECAYGNAPLYSPKGVETLKFKMAMSADQVAGRSVIGYYRSHRRDDLSLSLNDLKLIQQAFPSPDKVFLLIKPVSAASCTGGFFFWEDGKIQSEFTLEVPFAPLSPLSEGPSLSEGREDYIQPLAAGPAEPINS